MSDIKPILPEGEVKYGQLTAFNAAPVIIKSLVCVLISN